MRRAPVLSRFPGGCERAFDVVGFGLNSVDLLAVVAEHPAVEHQAAPAARRAPARRPDRDGAWRRARGSAGAPRTSAVSAATTIGALSRDSLVRPASTSAASRTVAGATNQFADHPRRRADGRSAPCCGTATRDSTLGAGRRSARRRHRRTHAASSTATTPPRRRRPRATRARRGVPTIVDVEKVRPGIADLLQQIDVIITAQDFPRALTGYEDLGRALAAMARRVSGAARLRDARRSRAAWRAVRRPRDSDAGVSGRLRGHDRAPATCFAAASPPAACEPPGGRCRGHPRVCQRRRRAELPRAGRPRRPSRRRRKSTNCCGRGPGCNFLSRLDGQTVCGFHPRLAAAGIDAVPVARRADRLRSEPPRGMSGVTRPADAGLPR